MLAAPPRSTYFWILPVAVLGRSVTKVIPRGALNRAILSLTKPISSSSVTAEPCASTTNACGVSPHFSLGSPTTAASTTAGCRSSVPSTSTEEMFSPPLMITSLIRSRISTYPSGCTTAASPVWNQPSPIAFLVASGSL